MAVADPVLPDVDFARDDVPDLHELLEHLRGRGGVVPVRFPAMRPASGRPAEIIGGVLRGPRELRVRPCG